MAMRPDINSDTRARVRLDALLSLPESLGARSASEIVAASVPMPAMVSLASFQNLLVPAIMLKRNDVSNPQGPTREGLRWRPSHISLFKNKIK
jgi:hypothetical protein